MATKRQKIQSLQLQLAFGPESEGAAPRVGIEGTEAATAIEASQPPPSDEALMEEICQRANLVKAWKRVRANQGSPGIDGRTTEATETYLHAHWPTIRDQLLAGTYQPQPVKRVELAKPGGGVRKLGIPTVVDRLIQQAILQVLQPQWDPTFSAHSYGFRPGRSAHQAIAQAQQYVADGYTWTVDIDLEQFFDRVGQDRLMSQVAQRVTDKRLLKLIRAFLTAGVMEKGLIQPTKAGTPQGSPLSPLLSNLVLDALDRELTRRGHRFCRYADDCNIYVRSQRAGQRVLESVTRFLTTRLRLPVNKAKSAVAPVGERTFLGFRIVEEDQPTRHIAPEALQRFKARIRTLTKRTAGVSLPRMIASVGQYLRGWRTYFGFCQTPRILHSLEAWIRRRLRSMVWKQWRSGRNRYAQLRRLGVQHVRAAVAAGSPTGVWQMARHVAVQTALSIAYFDALGLPRLEVPSLA